MKVFRIILTILKWLFVIGCIAVSFGMPRCFGKVIMVATAVIALPLPTIRDFWTSLDLNKVKPFIIAFFFVLAVSLGMMAENRRETAPPPTTDHTQTTLEQSENSSIPDEQELPPVETDSAPPFSILFIDVGDADAALVSCGGHHMLIDGGDKSDSSLIYTLLKNKNLTHLDIVIGSHSHADHIGGLPAALNYATADIVLCPVDSYNTDCFNDFKRYASEKSSGIVVPCVGDAYLLGDAVVNILGVNSASKENDTSIVVKITYKETSFLFSADAEKDTEECLLNSKLDLSASVLKVGHHGSNTSSSADFLKAVHPQYAIISVGKDNEYGHPADEVLQRLESAGIATYRTDIHGDIFLTSDGETIALSTEKACE